ncbi:MAG: DUF4342 domain-containing protein [Firmicutes bacterium]|nr:DUF4342 domain-containing protein [Bacillota bacterium]
MDKLEQIEKLRERAQVSYDEAKDAYEQANGDLLDALIYLEKQGKVRPPQGDGYYRSETSGDPEASFNERKEQESKKGSTGDETETKSFRETLERFGSFLAGLIRKGNNTSFEILKDKEHVASFPVTVLALVLLFAPHITLPAIVIGLFLGYHYQFVSNDN